MTRFGIILCGCMLFGRSVGFGYDWSTNPGSGEPNNPYQISEPNQLIAIGSNADLLNKCFILMNDIIFDQNSNPAHQFTTAVIAPDTDTASGYQGTPFTGCFDGSGYRIVNLYLANNSYLGLFGMIGSGGQVRNLELENVMINAGDDYLGGLAGYTDQGTIKDCRLTINITGRNYLGGVIGYNTGGTISRCTVYGKIEGFGSSSTLCREGGLAARSEFSLIDHCFAAVDLKGEEIISGGGLIGTHYSGMIQYSSAAGTVIGGKDGKIGGLVGVNTESTISFCSAFGDVAGPESSKYLGGLIGFNFLSTTSFCRASGNVTGGSYSENVGGLAGYSDGTTIEFCSASGRVTGGKFTGGLIGYGGPNLQFPKCYSEGDVNGTDYVGGFAGTFGFIPYDPPPCCYALGRVSAALWAQYVGGFKGQPYSGFPVADRRCYFLAREGMTDNFALPLTEDQMKQQVSFIEWDFVGETANGTEDIWRMCEDGTSYPKHAWEYGMYGDYACPEGVGIDDLEALALHWLTSEGNPGFSYACDGSGDGMIDLEDFAILSRHWLAPILSISQNRVEFFIPQADSSEKTQTLVIQNTGKSTLNWDMELLADLPEWLSIIPQNGILEPGESQSVAIEADIATLPIGYYDYICRIMGNSAQNNPQVLIVKLYVSPFAGGSGTPEDPFRIRTPEQLIAVGQDPLLLNKCFQLTSDIDLSGIVFETAVIAPSLENTGPISEFPSKPFTGVFDGNGYRIKNLTIHPTDTLKDDFIGLFGQIGIHGLVQNLGLENVSISGSSGSTRIGCLAGSNGGGIIRFCYGYGAIAGESIIGGLVGENGGMISNCYTAVIVNGNSFLGGITGKNFFYPPPSTGYGSMEGTIKTCYAAGNLTGIQNVGSISGTQISSQLVTACYFLETIGPKTLYTFPLTDAQMKQQASFVGWDFAGETANGTEDIWRMCEDGVHYPKLSWEDRQYGDYACPEGVGMDDLESLALHWLTSEGHPGFSYACDGSGDGVIDQEEMGILSKYWKE